MQQCGACGSENSNRSKFCGACGELIRVDPGLEKQVHRIIEEHRRRTRSKSITTFSVLVGILSFIGYQATSRMITVAVKRVTPLVEAQLHSEVERTVRADLPGVAQEASKHLAQYVGQELEEGYLQTARREAERIQPDFRARIEAMQAEYEGKLRAAYDSAQSNVRTQPLSAAWVSTAIPMFPASGNPSSTITPEMLSHSLAEELAGRGVGAALPMSPAIAQSFGNTSLATYCFTSNGTIGTFDPKDSRCKELTSQLPSVGSLNLVSTTQ